MATGVGVVGGAGMWGIIFGMCSPLLWGHGTIRMRAQSWRKGCPNGYHRSGLCKGCSVVSCCIGSLVMAVGSGVSYLALSFNKSCSSHGLS